MTCIQIKPSEIKGKQSYLVGILVPSPPECHNATYSDPKTGAIQQVRGAKCVSKLTGPPKREKMLHVHPS